MRNELNSQRWSVLRFFLSARLRIVLATPLLMLIVAVVAADFSALGQRRTRRRPALTTKTGVDYSKFSHVTEKHRGACQTCHKLPTKNSQEVRAFPDVADYPDHDACVSCHRRQFFKGTSPPICTVCHLKSSPREARRYAFRNPAATQQFAIEFPHDKHQDVIARLHPNGPLRPSMRNSPFIPVSFSWLTNTQDAPGKTYNNCSICHADHKTGVTAPLGGWIDSFVPDAATFKAVPLDHTSCFNCHWKSQAPLSTDCAGCHKAAAPHLEAHPLKRLSMKFRHRREQHIAECTTCHINITKAATLRGLTPDVPITSCTECHNKDGLRLDVSKELEAIDRNATFVCSYCHTSDVGRKDPPAGHYLIAGRETQKRKNSQ
jgi:hypothetical protein